MWLKAYLDLIERRPTWAFIANALINQIILPEVTSMEQVNTFLQMWDVPTQGPRAHNLPKYLLRMLQTAKKYHINFAALKLSKELKSQMPVWHHLGLTPNHYKKQKNKCLLENHAIPTIVDMVKLARRTENPTYSERRHHPRSTCACNPCKDDKRRGCPNPNKCSRMAHKILKGLHPKFDPKITPVDDGLTLTHQRTEKNNTNRAQKKGEILFDPSVTLQTELVDGFRIFTDPTKISPNPAHRLVNTRRGISVDEEAITAFTDGSCIINGKANAQSGAGIWISEGHPKNQAIKIANMSHSNQSGELVAVLATLIDAPNYALVQIQTDSRFVIDGLTKHLKDWEDRGWLGMHYKELFKATAYQLQLQLATTSFVWIKGHSGDMGNKRADALARKGATKQNYNEIDLTVPPEFDLQGAKLATITQTMAYQGVLKEKHKKHTDQKTTMMRLDITQYAIERINGNLEADQSIWHSCQSKDISLTIRQFIFKALHDTHHIGQYWDHIP
ncbi:ribonuclease H [Heterobasidion irregulare TC 32-1]|uniref:ribonuclease H n=1 Tax=Heterobasidion irregulare (strain TC 32-1) TaxID=747525 RepID=W4KBY6_HETIT|nr:ribonuclease H [Heterobasidion irregulare TC 32-1]ETW82840.1 ribonuclease H [Heterobasidion irregulare TC 32-1]